MALYAIGDLHLSLSANKPMDVFGGKWENYVEKLRSGFSTLGPEDVCVLCGDLSWGMSLEDSLADFCFIDELPGRKILLKGNHDYWWSTATKAQHFFSDHGLKEMQILHNTCFFYGDVAVCGTRGWFYEEETGGAHDRKIMLRELQRLETSLKLGGDREKLCFLHYPPRYKDYVCREILELFARYGVRACYYGHIHGPGHRSAIEGVVDGVEYRMVSADWINFTPVRVL